MIANEKYLLGSYEVSYFVTGKYGEFIRKIPWSNNNVTNRFSEIDKDQLVQLITRIKENPKLSTQLDETTDITKLAQWLVYVRNVCKKYVEEELLFCCPLKHILEGKTHNARLTIF